MSPQCAVIPRRSTRRVRTLLSRVQAPSDIRPWAISRLHRSPASEDAYRRRQIANVNDELHTRGNTHTHTIIINPVTAAQAPPLFFVMNSRGPYHHQARCIQSVFSHRTPQSLLRLEAMQGRTGLDRRACGAGFNPCTPVIDTELPQVSIPAGSYAVGRTRTVR